MEPLLGQISAFPYMLDSKQWLPCDGRLLRIREFKDLWQVLGNRYGGDGRETFALPDLQGRKAVGSTDFGGEVSGLTPVPLAQSGGRREVTLKVDDLPPHRHSPPAHSAASAQAPANAAPGKLSDSVGIGPLAFGPLGSDLSKTLHKEALQPAGKQPPSPVDIRNPSLSIYFFIAVTGTRS